jgi:hypothetical protein
MTVESIRRVLDAKPFQPFNLHLADGRSISIDHPEFVAYTGAGRTLFVGGVGEEFELVDLLLVLSISVLNGKPKTFLG